MDVKAHIRKHIQREFGHVPEWAYDLLWEEYADELEDRATWEWEDDEGEIWVKRMRLILRTAKFVGNGEATLPASVSRRRSAPWEEPPNTRDLAEAIETWWNVLPERDKRAVERMWDFGYNVTEVFAREFRQRYTGAHTLSFDEALNWLQHHARMENHFF